MEIIILLQLIFEIIIAVVQIIQNYWLKEKEKNKSNTNI